ncbi:hypothetical protein DVR12_24590 [Chitinophaga silvatica]|uniref:Abasic site processing protein n=1 Tax=Chitinophaga silvatica TaxID=2282649 RepID=A0A3E1Y397_9BACT|nr:SOS response-associated peptidase family protein [Chitinophaga silvatica]RFS19155.1 hypothetical protein DVR12_24590 [Chitinophaga silvatica]
MCYALSFSTELNALFNVLPALKEAPENDVGFSKIYLQTPDSFPSWPVVYNENGVTKITMMEWSVLPAYLESPVEGDRERRRNAFVRTTELQDPKNYWHRMSANRCLIPVTGYFEHHALDRQQGEIPYFIRVKDTTVFFIAGIYAYAPFADMETGTLNGTFAVITHEANELLALINNTGPLAGRMPLILTPALAEEWIDPDLIDIDIYDILTFTFRSDAMEYWSVNDLKTSQNNEIAIAKKEYPGLPSIR